MPSIDPRQTKSTFAVIVGCVSPMTEPPAEGPGMLASAVGGAGSVLRFMGEKTIGGAVMGVKLTKKAVQSLPNPLAHVDLERLTSKVPKVRLSGHSALIAQLFKHTPGAETVLPEDVSSDDEADYCTEEQLRERVDRKYFDPEFNAQKAEVNALPTERGDVSDKDLHGLEGAQKQRDDQMRAVHCVLKKKMLDNYQVFADAVCQFREVNGDLMEIADECRSGRERLALTRHSFVETGLMIPREKRRRDNLRALLAVLEAAAAAKKRNEQMVNLYESHRFRELLDVASKRYLKPQQTAVVQRLVSTQAFTATWNRIANNPEVLITDARETLDWCVTRRFDLSAYIGAVDAIACLSAENGVQLIVGHLLAACNSVVHKVLGEAGTVDSKSELPVIARSVPPNAAFVVICSMCAKILDTVALFNAAIAAHNSIVKTDDPARSKDEIQFHGRLAVAIADKSPEVGEILRQNLVDAVTNINLGDDGINALQAFYLSSLALESTIELKDPKKTIGSARSLLKNAVSQWVAKNIVASRASQMVEAMTRETWIRDSTVNCEDFLLVTSLKPDKFKDDVKAVRAFAKLGSTASENPFFNKEFALPSDLGATTVAFVPTPPFNFVTPSGSCFASTAIDLCARVVARYPQLATEVLDWLMQVYSLFVYLVAGSFISTSRTTPLEDQLDFSAENRIVMHEMRTACAACLPDLLDDDFPPPMFKNIPSERFSQAQHLYAITERLAPLATAATLGDFFAASLKTLGPLMTTQMLNTQLARVQQFKSCVVEMLHVGMHRLAYAILPLLTIGKDLTDYKWSSKEGIQPPGPHVERLKLYLEKLQEMVARQLRFPTRHLENLFWRHMTYAIQTMLVTAFAQVKKKSDTAVHQMSVDSQAVHQMMREIVGASNVVSNNYVAALLRVYFSPPVERRKWAVDNARLYRRVDLVLFLGDDRESRTQLEDALKDIRDDHVYVDHIVAMDNQLQPGG